MIPSLLLSRLSAPRRAVAGGVAVLLCICGAPVAAQSGDPPGRSPSGDVIENLKYDDWALVCRPLKPGGPQRCVLVQIRGMRQSGKKILSVTIGRFGGEKALMAAVTVPLGILLPAGIRLEVDDKEIVRIPLQFCNVNGCQGRFPMTDGVRTTLESGKAGRIVVRQPNGSALRIQLSLQGFRNGMAALDAR